MSTSKYYVSSTNTGRNASFTGYDITDYQIDTANINNPIIKYRLYFDTPGIFNNITSNIESDSLKFDVKLLNINETEFEVEKEIPIQISASSSISTDIYNLSYITIPLSVNGIERKNSGSMLNQAIKVYPIRYRCLDFYFDYNDDNINENSFVIIPIKFDIYNIGLHTLTNDDINFSGSGNIQIILKINNDFDSCCYCGCYYDSCSFDEYIFEENCTCTFEDFNFEKYGFNVSYDNDEIILSRTIDEYTYQQSGEGEETYYSCYPLIAEFINQLNKDYIKSIDYTINNIKTVNGFDDNFNITTLSWKYENIYNLFDDINQFNLNPKGLIDGKLYADITINGTKIEPYNNILDSIITPAVVYYSQQEICNNNEYNFEFGFNYDISSDLFFNSYFICDEKVINELADNTNITAFSLNTPLSINIYDLDENLNTFTLQEPESIKWEVQNNNI